MNTKKKLAFSLLLFALSLFSQEKSDELIPSATNPSVTLHDGPLLVEGITVVRGGVLVDRVKREHGVIIELGDGDYEQLARALEPYLQQPLNPALLEEIKKSAVTFFREVENSSAVAVIPEQHVVNENVVLQILEGTVGRIEYKGQKWFAERVIRNGLGIEPGDPLNEEEFLNDVAWINRSPFRFTQMILVPSQEMGQTDLTFVTKDRFTARFYAGADNTGFITNGTLRLYGGCNWGDAFTIGDLLSYQYTASVDFHELQSHVASYSSFLPCKHFLTVFGCYGQIYPVIPDFNATGVNVQGSARYEIPIRPFYGAFRNSIYFGFDYKYLTSNLFFTGDTQQSIPEINQKMTITQFLFSYSFQRNWKKDLLSFKIDMYASPWKNGFPFQSTTAYAGLRPFSHVRYAYWKMAISELHKTENQWALSLQLRGQLATCTLPTAEQFFLGGMDTVRGYFENQFVADDALCFNGEIYTPPFSLIRKIPNQFAFVAFIDYAYGYNYTAQLPTLIQQNLLGIGPGVRLDVESYLSVKMDYGFQVLGIPGDHRTGRFHFSATASY